MKIQNKPIPLSGTSLEKGRNRTSLAFTLVELIIVITILAILATIGFMSFQSYTLDARDGKRVTDLGEIRKGLEIYQTKNQILPIPDAQVVNIGTGSSVLVYQGYAGINVLNKIKASDIKDPKENIAYTYSTNGDYTKFQLLSMLENGTTANLSQTPVNTTYASTDYTGRKSYVIGNKLGMFLNPTTNAPIQETLSGNIDLGGNYSGTTFKVIFSNTSTNSGTITGTGASLYNNIIDLTKITPQAVTVKVGEQTNPGLSCLDILNKGGSIGDGTYWIKPDSNPAFQVYCDMTTDGGGWTLIAKTFATTNDSITGSIGNVYDYNSATFTKLSDLNINTILSTNSGQRYFMGTGISLTTYWKVVDNTFIWDSLGNTNNGTTSVNAKTYISKTGINGTYYASYRPIYPSGYYGAGIHYWGYRNGTTAGYAGTSIIWTAGCPGYLTYQGNNILGSGNCYGTTGGPVIWYLK